MNTVIIVQARMGSSRLPGKVLKPLGDSVVLDYVVKRCNRITNAAKVVVATSTHDRDYAIVEWCSRNNVEYFRGSELDVLARYYQCAKYFDADIVVRVTADCPFVDYELADECISKMKIEKTDILRMTGELPRGLTVEIFSFESLEYMYRYGTESHQKEHVTYYSKEYPSEFDIDFYRVPSELEEPSLRITLDTEEDYVLCTNLAKHFYQDIFVSSKNVVNYLIENSEVANINAHITQKNVK
ncbi:spore coat polysaccharide biosynthesis protein SpsF [Salibacterium salarium]|uniref:glycosyltransferase family protein n=1 Tax=Salibacterium salarium TaxID=284579 RepID=UPI00278380DE|nr:glycosyltransferase family protein [Salibacterium salarium]MDQ0298231.1 spore coat polysaccharide biosynthesis protein SpsF [Salibacterium salarium]